MSADKTSKKLKTKTSENEKHDAHIPVALRDPVVVLSPAQAYSGNLPTIFIGVRDEDYTEAMWMKHADRISQLFNLEMNVWAHHVKVNGTASNTIDADQMACDVSAASNMINQLQQQLTQPGAEPFPAIRIVGMGIHAAIAMYHAIEALVKGWNLDWSRKIVQFVALGDSKSGHYLNFCKALCLKKICAQVQFYKTMDYDHFGYFREDLLQLSTKEDLEEMLANARIAAEQNPE